MAAGGALAAVLFVSGCGSDPSDAPVEKKSFAFEGKTLTIDTSNAEIDLVPADVTSVDVTRQIDGWVLLGSGPNGVWKMDGSTLTLKVKCTGLANDCSSRHEVKVPRGVAVTLEGDNGKVTATGFTTALKLVSDNGAITVADSSGPLDLKTDNGSVTARNVSSRTVTARSDNGAIRLGLTEAPDSVDTASDNGGTEITLPPGGAYAVTTSSDNGAVNVDVEKDATSPHVVKARSDNGKITVRTAN
ncbi:DUF4097 family beta strand repeat-containing protein [Streptomyces sp. NPDC093109]|uniref:DUF4097 family beta strand repeat-containing protein n=1 Tax=Streptomyces sp. NPDC093109 TaxID=3154977 RepID=UPI003450FD25